MLTPIMGILFVLGIALLLFGWRGRQLNDHPHCRACRFDLSGRNPHSDACPECGSDLSARRAIRRGIRQRRRGPFLAGVFLAFIALAWFTMLGYGLTQGDSIHDYKPDWLLATEARWLEAGDDLGPLEELTERMKDGELSSAAVASLIEHALEFQRDHDREWIPEWALFIEHVRIAGRTTKEQYEQYQRNLATIDVELRPIVQDGEGVPVRIRVADVRGPGYQMFQLTVTPEVMVVDDLDLLIESPNVRSRPQSAGDEWTFDAWMPLNAGDNQFTLRFLASVQSAYAGAPALKWRFEEAFDVQVVPTGEDTVTPVRDDAMADAIRAAISIDEARFFRGANVNAVHVLFSAVELPMPVAFDMFIRIGDQEFAAGTYWCRADQQTPRRSAPTARIPQDLEPPTSADLILRANPAIAEQTADIFEIWDGEIIFEDVPVRDFGR